MRNRQPFCSVIILNYFGERVIEGAINSLLNLNYPKNKYEIIVVDNNSQDKSREILSKLSQNSQKLKLIFLDRNLGFSAGNNVGINQAKGEYVALVNNDVIVEKNWLKELVKTAWKDDKIFAVNSKILLYPKHLNIKFQIHSKLSPVFSWLSKSHLYEKTDSKRLYLPIFRKMDSFTIELPYEPFEEKEVEFVILFSTRGSKLERGIDLRKIISLDNKAFKISFARKDEDNIEYYVTVDTQHPYIAGNSLNKIQNAGIMVFQDGYGRDIGAIVSGHKQFHEYDIGQYNKEREVYAACGAAVLYNKKILDKIGFLDEHFFMYYEDVEISERARFAGFKTMYSPKAVVRHHHALFSKEWSPFFIYHVEKGRLLHVFYNFPLRVFLLAYYRLVLDSSVNMFVIIFRIKYFMYKLRTKTSESGEPNFVRRIQMTKALAYFIILFPLLLAKRLKYNFSRKRGVVEQNYLKILKGDWYF